MPLFNSPEEIRTFERALKTRAIGRHVRFVERTKSTNDLALQAARGDGAQGEVFVADAQDGGRGRRGRTWECPPALGLLFSVLFRPRKLEATECGWIPLTAGLACVEALEDTAKAAACPLQPALKWPNDIVLPDAAPPGWKKLGGILCESALPSLESRQEGFVVIGIGLNINQSPAELPRAAKAPPASLLTECGAPFGRKDVFARTLTRLDALLLKLEDDAQRPKLKQEIAARLKSWWTPNVTLTIETPMTDSAMLRGTFAGLDDFGRLIISSSDGKQIALADAQIVAITASPIRNPQSTIRNR